MESPEKNLHLLIQQLKPTLNTGEFVYCHLPMHEFTPSKHYIFYFREREGMTVLLEKATADELGWRYSLTLAWITLNVHSSLEAIGLTAAVAHALTEQEISCNVVAAYYHDHLFVPIDKAESALQTLINLSQNGSN